MDAHRADYRNKIARDERVRRKNMKNDNGKTQTITLRLTKGMVKNIQANENLFGGYYRRRGGELEDSLARQIVKKAGKLFPEIAEEERQTKLAFEIAGAHRGVMVDIRQKYETKMKEVQERYNEAHKAMSDLENEMQKEVEVIINLKFDEAGITLFRSSSSGYGLMRTEEKE